MYLLYFIFFLSLSAAFTMIGLRLRDLKQGKIPFPESAAFSRWFQLFSEWEKKSWEIGKNLSMHFLSLFLRLAIIAVDRVRKSMRHTVSRIEEALVKKNANKNMQGAASVFLKDIAEHKKKIQERFKKENNNSSSSL